MTAKCPTPYKVKYNTKTEADKALTEFRKKDDEHQDRYQSNYRSDQVNSYSCKCGKFHLTKELPRL